MPAHACSQNQSAAATVPVSMRLPPGVGAVDFYLDLAIDCVNTTSVTMPCFVMTDPTAANPLVVIKNVSSICASARVGQYFGFYNNAGACRRMSPLADCMADHLWVCMNRCIVRHEPPMMQPVLYP